MRENSYEIRLRGQEVCTQFINYKFLCVLIGSVLPAHQLQVFLWALFIKSQHWNSVQLSSTTAVLTNITVILVEVGCAGMHHSDPPSAPGDGNDAERQPSVVIQLWGSC